VTGASSGNGRAIALRLASEGCRVVCADLRPEALAGGYEEHAQITTLEITEQSGGQAIFVGCDVTSSDQVAGLVSTTIDTFGRLDVMVSNAGITASIGTIVDETEADFDRTVAVISKASGCAPSTPSRSS
jgi:NAD(P)-dependent dehydrogenase (short-subunit alcohol dehydrogenase family)